MRLTLTALLALALSAGAADVKFQELANASTVASNALFAVSLAGAGSRHISFGQLWAQIGQTNDTTKATTATTITIAGTANEVTSSAGAQDLSANRTWTLSLPTGISAGKIGGGNVSSTEFDFLDGVTSAIQTQFATKMTTNNVLFLVSTNDASTLTNLNASNIASGTLPAGRFPALTGDVTTSAGSLATTIAPNSVALTTDTTGNYVADVAGTANEIASTHTPGEGSTATLSLPATIDLSGKTSFNLPTAAAPTVDAAGEIATDNNLWASGRGSVIHYDGTAATALIGVLVSDTPSNGQVPKWNTGGTITWEADNDTGGAGGGTNQYYPATDPDLRIKLGGDNAFAQWFNTAGSRIGFLDDGGNLSTIGNIQLLGGSLTVTNQASVGSAARIAVVDENGTFTASANLETAYAKLASSQRFAGSNSISGGLRFEGPIYTSQASNTLTIDVTAAPALYQSTNRSFTTTWSGTTRAGWQLQCVVSNYATTNIVWTIGQNAFDESSQSVVSTVTVEPSKELSFKLDYDGAVYRIHAWGWNNSNLVAIALGYYVPATNGVYNAVMGVVTQNLAAVAFNNNAAATTNLGIVTSVTIPMGAWFSNNIAPAPLTSASAVIITNSCDTFEFADGVTNAIRFRGALPWDWDAGTVQVELTSLSRFTNGLLATNSVFAVRAAAIATGGTEDNPTWGTGIWLTNKIDTRNTNFVSYKTISTALTVGNTPTSAKSILWEIQRLGAATGDTTTNLVAINEVRIYLKRNTRLDFPTATP